MKTRMKGLIAAIVLSLTLAGCGEPGMKWPTLDEPSTVVLPTKHSKELFIRDSNVWLNSQGSPEIQDPAASDVFYSMVHACSLIKQGDMKGGYEFVQGIVKELQTKAGSDRAAEYPKEVDLITNGAFVFGVRYICPDQHARLVEWVKQSNGVVQTRPSNAVSPTVATYPAPDPTADRDFAMDFDKYMINLGYPPRRPSSIESYRNVAKEACSSLRYSYSMSGVVADVKNVVVGIARGERVESTEAEKHLTKATISLGVHYFCSEQKAKLDDPSVISLG